MMTPGMVNHVQSWCIEVCVQADCTACLKMSSLACQPVELDCGSVSTLLPMKRLLRCAVEKSWPASQAGQHPKNQERKKIKALALVM